MCYRLCVYASGSLITVILMCFMLISASCLHFGQNSGKFSSTVPSLSFKRVFLLQTGQSTHSLFKLSLNFVTKSLQISRQPFSTILGYGCAAGTWFHIARTRYSRLLFQTVPKNGCTAWFVQSTPLFPTPAYPHCKGQSILEWLYFSGTC